MMRPSAAWGTVPGLSGGVYIPTRFEDVQAAHADARLAAGRPSRDRHEYQARGPQNVPAYPAMSVNPAVAALEDPSAHADAVRRWHRSLAATDRDSDPFTGRVASRTTHGARRAADVDADAMLEANAARARQADWREGLAMRRTARELASVLAEPDHEEVRATARREAKSAMTALTSEQLEQMGLRLRDSPAQRDILASLPPRQTSRPVQSRKLASLGVTDRDYL